jgi:hypothetical protein
MVYALKADEAGDAPLHWICPQCYEDAKRSILQPETRFPGRNQVLVCNRCETDIITSGARDVSSPRRK